VFLGDAAAGPRIGVICGRTGGHITRHAFGATHMNEHEFQGKLADLLRQIGTLPEGERPKLEALAAETRTRHEKMKKTIAELQDSLDYLRLSVKYLVFDLEATRRENKYLRSLIEANKGDDASGAD
jgi:hypothetical protein